MAFAGGRNLGVETLKWLCSLEYIDVVAVCPLPELLDLDVAKEMQKTISDNKLYACEIQDLLNIDIDLGLSVNYHKIINKDVLQHCKIGFYNVHHSYNLRLRGRNITTHAILNTLTENVWYHGTTLHKMVAKLDAGPIVESRACKISSKDTAYTLFSKVDIMALSMIKDWIPRIALQKVFLYEPPVKGIHYYKDSDLPDKKISLNAISMDEMDTHIRAFDFPQKEPAFIEDKGRKIHLVYKQRDIYCNAYKLYGRKYYTDVLF